MTKSELIEAMADFPGDMPVKLAEDQDITAVTEICPTQIDTSENYLLIA